jgi:hypothetical protein
MIDSSIAATRQLHTALRILDEDDLSAHMLAYNAYCLLRDKFGLGDAFAAIEEKLGLRSIPATDVIAGGGEIGDIAEITLGSTDSGLERGPRRK